MTKRRSELNSRNEAQFYATRSLSGPAIAGSIDLDFTSGDIITDKLQSFDTITNEFVAPKFSFYKITVRCIFSISTSLNRDSPLTSDQLENVLRPEFYSTLFPGPSVVLFIRKNALLISGILGSAGRSLVRVGQVINPQTTPIITLFEEGNTSASLDGVVLLETGDRIATRLIAASRNLIFSSGVLGVHTYKRVSLGSPTNTFFALDGIVPASPVGPISGNPLDFGQIKITGVTYSLEISEFTRGI